MSGSPLQSLWTGTRLMGEGGLSPPTHIPDLILLSFALRAHDIVVSHREQRKCVRKTSHPLSIPPASSRILELSLSLTTIPKFVTYMYLFRYHLSGGLVSIFFCSSSHWKGAAKSIYPNPIFYSHTRNSGCNMYSCTHDCNFLNVQLSECEAHVLWIKMGR